MKTEFELSQDVTEVIKDNENKEITVLIADAKTKKVEQVIVLTNLQYDKNKNVVSADTDELTLDEVYANLDDFCNKVCTKCNESACHTCFDPLYNFKCKKFQKACIENRSSLD